MAQLSVTGLLKAIAYTGAALVPISAIWCATMTSHIISFPEIIACFAVAPFLVAIGYVAKVAWKLLNMFHNKLFN